MNNKSVRIVKVVTKNFVMDFVAKIQNMFGYNLSSYERMITKAIDSIEKELYTNGYDMKWYRYEISQLNNGAMAVMFYGDRK